MPLSVPGSPVGALPLLGVHVLAFLPVDLSLPPSLELHKGTVDGPQDSAAEEQA